MRKIKVIMLVVMVTRKLKVIVVIVAKYRVGVSVERENGCVSILIP